MQSAQLAVEGSLRAAVSAERDNPDVYERLTSLILETARTARLYTADDINKLYEQRYGQELTRSERLGSAIRVYLKLKKAGTHSNLADVIQTALWQGDVQRARSLQEQYNRRKRSTITRRDGSKRHGTLTTVWYSHLAVAF